MKNLISEKYRVLFFFIVLVIICIFFLMFFLNQKSVKLPRNAEQKSSESFTFFDVGENTVLTKAKLKDLRRILGQHRLENLTPVYLDFVHRGWLAKYFPDLEAFDIVFEKPRLRDPIASNTIKLHYRYAHQKNIPFRDIRFVFSRYTNKPLLLFLRLPGDGNIVINNLKNTHGMPQTIENVKIPGPGPVYFWERGEDLLVTSVLSDRYGKPETHIFIFYGKNAEIFKQTIMEKYPEPDIKTGF
ncbi:hypothetical protein LZ24_00589 [Desulfobotulus alkaliphilus]|uniref:Uncharacterized protein n=1 Tax=Desulfobotulus alkaliphilus TaxID=622671 RepID=A0A562S2H1_9BACT|nr:hypothetical protein [Desulfobotulus alkaliphilus]TWI75542.1 hypothetical protein LZ24_00589 [Desulfobotulus alkaliphilus]